MGRGPGRAGPEPLVRVRGVRKRFGGTPALDGVDLDLARGSVLALVGCNGAGKSTLIKILAGVHRADAGEVTVAGHPLGGREAAERMSFVHQDPALVEWMSVAENVALGAGYPLRGGLISRRAARRRCGEALDAVGARIDPGERAGDLTRAERSLVAVARALARDTEVIVLDEPTASLAAADRERLFAVLRELRGRGRGIVYVSHRLGEVRELADSVAVLRDGRVVRQGPLDDGGRPARRGPAGGGGHDRSDGADGGGPDDLVRAMVGGEPAVHLRARREAGEVVLSVRALRTELAGPVSFELRAGEAIGLTGQAGAGHVDVGRALAGARPVVGGRVLLGGRPFRPRSAPEAVAAGVGMVAGDRMEEGAAPGLSVRENVLANPRLRGGSPLTWLGPRRERERATALLACLGVRPTGTELPFTALSGGNQQKALVGRWLWTGRRVLVLEEPTAGVDVAARPEIHRLLDAALRDGLAVLLVSADAEEIAHVCDRALVLADGSVIAELTGDALTVTGVTRAVTGAGR
ncbi:sugar ABC transporter ATP-binding protein [Nonomuraea rhodomycinica]|uniref:Sugar ABC transporter ATP-binding protein n=1 Tax=Nonomuraea rhodomycinica TaxID=1712872 RepID=A0A7Y6IP68_9ACTN|nr:sugar ABC transporter ATP-binding protein [Nonomuraea rhodomycinica]